MNLLARQAECLFWLGRYIERTSSLARILMVQTAFDRGRAAGSTWGWLLALYDESEDFHKRYETADSKSVIRYFVIDPEHAGSVLRSLEALRSNARALRAMISTDFWMHANRAHRKVKDLPDAALRETRLAATCEAIQIDCYALMGISGSTLYRDAGWRFFELGIEIERADQMSRLLDVRFAQLQTGATDGGTPIGDFTHWTMLLRACGGHHAYRRLVSGPLQPENVARFLIFEQSFARSIAHTLGECERSINELRTICGVPTPTSVLKRISDLKDMVHTAQKDPGLVTHLHNFNDAIQCHLIELTTDLGDTYFDMGSVPGVVSADTSEESKAPEWVQPAEEKESGKEAGDNPTADIDKSAASKAQASSSGRQSQTQSQRQSSS